MKRAILIVALTVLMVFSAFAASDQSSVVTVGSVVLGNIQGNPKIIIGIGATDMSQYLTQDKETTVITGLNLTKDGSYSFVLLTSEEVILGISKRTAMEIEIYAEGFDLYDYDYNGATEGSSMESASIKMKNAVPILSTTPEIKIPTFSGKDQNVSVSHIGSSNNKISVEFLPGMTKANLILGSFTVEWNGKRPLDAGIYKAKVSVIYSTK